MIMMGNGASSPMASRVMPLAELKVSVSSDASRTSEKRLSAQNP